MTETVRTTYSFRHATMADLPVILNLRDQAREIMRSYGNTFQWPDGYPPEEKFIHDIEQGCSYVMADATGTIVGTFALIPGPDITYKVIYNGQWRNDEPYYVIHRIASTPNSHGILDAVLDYSETIAPNIRIDTHEANIIMRKGLEKHGYQYCGIIHLLNGDERLAYQRIVTTPMKPLHLTYIQANLLWEDPKGNREHFDPLLKEVPIGTDLVLLPETFNTAFPVDPKAFAETEDGPTMQWIKQKAQELNAVISGTLLLETDGHYHNSLVWMCPDGQHKLYHKRHTFSIGGETLPVERGSESLIVELNDWRIKPMVCYDIRFPVWSRNRFQEGRYEYDLGIYLANFPASRMNVWNTLLQARAIENQAYYIGVNRVGDDPEGVHYSGCSQVLNAKGEVISMAKTDMEAVVSCVLDDEKLRSFREKFPVGKDWDPLPTVHPYGAQEGQQH